MGAFGEGAGVCVVGGVWVDRRRGAARHACVPPCGRITRLESADSGLGLGIGEAGNDHDARIGRSSSTAWWFAG